MTSDVLLRTWPAGASGHQEGAVWGKQGRQGVQVWRVKGQWNVHVEMFQGELYE